jgi:outer membrane immunogenic protein
MQETLLGWDTQFSGTNFISTSTGATTGFTSLPFSRNGYFIGSGTEIMLWNRWFARAEYRYADYGTTNISENPPVGPAAVAITFHPVIQSARTELVYKFNWFK